jgi:hypothetical protein
MPKKPEIISGFGNEADTARPQKSGNNFHFIPKSPQFLKGAHFAHLSGAGAAPTAQAIARTSKT